jgi:type II secretory pathway pseudopilin PulG
MRNRLPTSADAGLTLIELMIVVSVIIVIASISIPNLIGARLTSNEAAALAMLRTISSAQAQFQAAAKVDTDQDGSGEYGYFGELSGGTRLRDSVGGVNGAALTTPILSAAFRAVNGGVVTRGGYMFRLLLPDFDGIGVGEAADGGADPGNLPDADMCEVTWCCYAWPIQIDTTGSHVFFVNQRGDLVQSNNQAPGQRYSGAATPPEPDAAFVSPATDDAIVGVVAVSTTGADGGRWVPAK